MSSEYHTPKDGREFTPSEERFKPLIEILNDPRLEFEIDQTTRAQYESLIHMFGSENVHVRESIPADPNVAPTTNIVFGKPPEDES